MSQTNQVVSNFPQIANYNANGNVTGITVGNLTATANVNLGNVANVHINGGNINQVLATDSTGNLSWTTNGILANNMVFTNSTYAPNATYVAPWTSGNPIVLNGTGNLQAQLPVGTQVRFRNDGPAYTVAQVGQLVLNSQYSIVLTANTSETVGTANTLQITTLGLANTLASGTGIAFTANANTGVLTVNVTSTNQITNGNSNVSVAANSNVTFGVSGNANVLKVTGSRVIASRGVAAISTSADEFLSVGSNTSGNTILGLNTDNNQYEGVRFAKQGNEQWFLGTDDSRATGNFILNAPTGQTATQQPIKVDSTRGTTYTLSPSLVYGAAGVTQSAQSNVTFYPQLFLTSTFNPPGSRGSTATEAEMGVTRDTNSPYTVTFNTAGLYLITIQVSFAPNTTGSRLIVFSSDSSSNVYAGVNMIQQTNGGTATYPTTIQGAAPVYCRSGDTYTLKVLQNSGANLTVGGTAANVCTLTITRL